MRYSQVIKAVHNQLFHSLNSIVKVLIRRVFPDIAFPHLNGDELWMKNVRMIGEDAVHGNVVHIEEVMDVSNLVIRRGWFLGKIIQKTMAIRPAVSEFVRRLNRFKLYLLKYLATGSALLDFI